MTLTVAALVAAICLSTAAADAQPPGTVEVLVLYPDGREAEGVRVTVRDADGRGPEVTTDAEGRAVVTLARAGMHRVTAHAPGFIERAVDVSMSVHATSRIRVPLMLAQNERPDSVDALAGVVVDVHGNPLAQVAVCAHAPFLKCDGDSAVLTDHGGRFRLSASTSQPVVLTAMGRGYLGAAVSPTPDRAQTRTVKIVAAPADQAHRRGRGAGVR